MAGTNPLWVAKQHGHSISTMLRVYAAWAEGAVESDVEAIRRSMNRHARLKPISQCRTSAVRRPLPVRDTHPAVGCVAREGSRRIVGSLAVDLPLQAEAKTQVPETKEINLAEREGLFGPAGLTPSGRPPGVESDERLEAAGHDNRRITPRE